MFALKAKEIMERDLTSLMEDETVERFIIICKRHNLSALPIVASDFRLVGYLSETGIIDASLPGYLKLMETTSFIPDSHQFFNGLRKILDRPVSDFMIKKPFKVYFDDTVLHVADVIIKNKLKVLPVVDDDERLVGVIRRIGLLSKTLTGEIEYEA
ncbi:MAG: CBS domain-containing protein [Thermotogota bacterium]|nr:CBS domain-containing protein [Thermotogota bacterium]